MEFTTAATDNIYGEDGGNFGDVWGWRFFGVFHGFKLLEPDDSCIKCVTCTLLCR